MAAAIQVGATVFAVTTLIITLTFWDSLLLDKDRHCRLKAVVALVCLPSLMIWLQVRYGCTLKKYLSIMMFIAVLIVLAVIARVIRLVMFS
jgi:hypothetical protein